MVQYNRITWVVPVLQSVGIRVVTHKGWLTRGLTTAQRFTPTHVVWHHDASAKGDSPGVPQYMIDNFASAGAQIWVDRYGTWHIIASGRAAHAGKVVKGKPGNHDSIGIETDHTVNEVWPEALLLSLRKGTAAILKHMKEGPSSLEFHKTIAPGRKIDPDGLDLTQERQRVAAFWQETPRPPSSYPYKRQAGPKEHEAVDLALGEELSLAAIPRGYKKLRQGIFLGKVLPWREQITSDKVGDVLTRVRADTQADLDYIRKTAPGKTAWAKGFERKINYIDAMLRWDKENGK